MASILINVFKATNIGTVLVASLTELLNNTSFSGIPLIILLFLISAVTNIFTPSPTTRWAILAVAAVPTFMNNSMSPAFTQTVFRFSEALTTGLTPFLAYFAVYLGYIEKYNQDEKPVSLFTSLKYQLPYGLLSGALLLVILMIWYLTGLPLGISSSVTI